METYWECDETLKSEKIILTRSDLSKPASRFIGGPWVGAVAHVHACEGACVPTWEVRMLVRGKVQGTHRQCVDVTPEQFELVLIGSSGPIHFKVLRLEGLQQNRR